MTVYVDRIIKHGITVGSIRGKSCHLVGTDASELKRFAREKLRMRDEWCSDVTQPGASILHYDLVPSKRALALRAGALPMDWHDCELVARLVRQPKPESEVGA